VQANLNLFTRDEVEALASARLIAPNTIAANWRQFPDLRKQTLAREFYMGRPPTWEIAISDVPAKLAQNQSLRPFLSAAIERRDRFSVVIGQTGCGKSTAVMRELLLLTRDLENVNLVEVSPDVVSLSRTIRAAQKFLDKKFTIFFVPDLYPFGGAMKADIQQIAPGDALVVTTSRESEWHGNFKRYIGGLGQVHEFKRFSAADEPELIDKLGMYVPSPTFAKLTFEQKLKRLQASKRQLLIALREVTESVRFDEMMRDEYIKLNDDAKRTLFGIAAVSSLARAGIRTEMAYSTFESPPINTSFKEALDGLAGVVFADSRERLTVRHDVYSRYILEEVMPFADIVDAITRILVQFTRYEIPIIRSVSRLDGALFKFLLNNNFLFELAHAHGVSEDGLKIYRAFEVPFQADGHFWLQYGLYYDRLGELGKAEEMLRKSIQAYPENIFAEHAHARLRLRIAAREETGDLEADKLMADAVTSLNALDARDPIAMDEYPLVTLAFFHIDALLRREKRELAKTHARDYLTRLKYMERRTTGESVKAAIDQLTIFLATGDWRALRKEYVSE
jgi:tetratricopeptide (TPR) repeat protein